MFSDKKNQVFLSNTFNHLLNIVIYIKSLLYLQLIYILLMQTDGCADIRDRYILYPTL